MSAPTVVRPAIAPLDLDGALATYRQHCADMTDQQLTEERHRLEAQPPYGEAHRIANEVFEKRNPVARLEHITAGGAAMKRRLFTFCSGSTARVTCKHCGWTSRGRGDAQKVFDRSNDHECAGVESYAAMLARHAVEAVAR